MADLYAVTILAGCQAAIPKDLVSLLHLREGDELQVTAEENRILFVKIRRPYLFAPEVVQRLDERQAEIKNGRYSIGRKPKGSAAGGE